jgi:hypothetical protein
MNQTTRNKSDKEIEQNYFLWLCDIVGIGRTSKDRRARELAWFLHNREFTYFIPNDDNRAEDGKKLREHYSDAFLDSNDCVCLDGPCTVFEMLVALAKRIEYQVAKPQYEDRTSLWFWGMVNNLDLQPFLEGEPRAERKIERNNMLVDQLLNRTYSRLGKGGLFPLRRSAQDQRKIEIWYQMMAYLEENYVD